MTISEREITPEVQKWIASHDGLIPMRDAAMLVGSINTISKRVIGDNGVMIHETDPEPKSVVAFCPSIKASKAMAESLNHIIEILPKNQRDELFPMQAQHIDGSMTTAQRERLLSWLKEEADECRILTNVRCLSEGVDVPSLDAVMFFSVKNSQVDIVHIPVVMPANVPPDKVMDATGFKVVWSVMNALRAHDDRFNSVVNKIGLNKKQEDDKDKRIVDIR